MVHHHHLPWLLALLGLALAPFLPLPAVLAMLGLAAAGWAVFCSYLERSVRRLPVTTGREGLLGQPVQVLARVGNCWQVRHVGEVWSAVSPDNLLPGQQARIVAFRGLKLVIEQDDSGASPETQALAEARRSLRRALARLQWQAAELDRAAAVRAAAADRALPGRETVALDYLAQRRALLARRDELVRDAAQLQAELARVETLLALSREGSQVLESTAPQARD